MFPPTIIVIASNCFVCAPFYCNCHQVVFNTWLKGCLTFAHKIHMKKRRNLMSIEQSASFGDQNVSRCFNFTFSHFVILHHCQNVQTRHWDLATENGFFCPLTKDILAQRATAFFCWVSGFAQVMYAFSCVITCRVQYCSEMRGFLTYLGISFHIFVARSVLRVGMVRHSPTHLCDSDFKKTKCFFLTSRPLWVALDIWCGELPNGHCRWQEWPVAPRGTTLVCWQFSFPFSGMTESCFIETLVGSEDCLKYLGWLSG